MIALHELKRAHFDSVILFNIFGLILLLKMP